MEGRQRRLFTDDYKRQAVDLVASSGRSIGSVAKELGLRDSVLRRWAKVDADTGEEVSNDDIMKGYKVDTDTYIEVSKDELENVARNPHARSTSTNLCRR